MKKSLFTLALVLLGLSVYSNPTDTIPSQRNLYDDASIDDEGCCTIVDWKSTKLSQYTLHEVNGCVSYHVRYDERTDSYVVDFTNHCGAFVDIVYEYYSLFLQKWVTGFAHCSADETSYDNNAGAGKVRNVTYTFR